MNPTDHVPQTDARPWLKPVIRRLPLADAEVGTRAAVSDGAFTPS